MQLMRIFAHNTIILFSCELAELFLLGKGGAGSSGEFQEVEGETEERRKARLERHQRTQERAVCFASHDFIGTILRVTSYTCLLLHSY